MIETTRITLRFVNLLLILFFGIFIQIASSQENCTISIDDYVDGLKDRQDFDCANFSTCKIGVAFNIPDVYWMPSVWADKAADCSLFGKDDIYHFYFR